MLCLEQDIRQLLLQWINWTLTKLSSSAKILVNLHDLPEVMRAHFHCNFFPQIAAVKEFMQWELIVE